MAGFACILMFSVFENRRQNIIS